ncbi:MAG: c-type cytochrome biogenesis protein CcmI [Paracoccaceae bacterium]
MVFWIALAAMTLCVAVTMALPLLRGRGDGGVAATPDRDLYRAQLDEIERDLARGTLDAGQAEAARTEVARRLLAADRAGPDRTGEAPRAASWIAALSIAALSAGGLWAYDRLGAPGYADMPRAERLAASAAARANRPDQATAEAAQAALSPPRPLPEGEDGELIAQLRAIVPERPDDLQGWRLLAFHEARLGDMAAARAAQDRVAQLSGEDAEAVRLLDVTVAAAGGYVSPLAEALARARLAQDRADPAGRYYLGLLYDQTDRPDLAFQLWEPLLEGGGVHARLARGAIEDAAFRAGLDWTLPKGAGPALSEEAIAAARDMAPEDRNAMILGMVGRLSERLATQGGPAADWARLIEAYGVLGDGARASAILDEARQVFADRAGDVALLDAAGRRAGLE